jgi:hypothetical protein
VGISAVFDGSPTAASPPDGGCDVLVAVEELLEALPDVGAELEAEERVGSLLRVGPSLLCVGLSRGAGLLSVTVTVAGAAVEVLSAPVCPQPATSRMPAVISARALMPARLHGSSVRAGEARFGERSGTPTSARLAGVHGTPRRGGGGR